MAILNVQKVTKQFGRNSGLISLTNILFSKNIVYKNINIKALDCIDFDLSPGESFGVIGRNGSGKSTLLQIISGTLKSTEGNVTINGRLSALLELGSGFNPEFTGIENVYLSGAILGIDHNNMTLKLPEIEAFAEIGNYINQPVRTYSTGMLMRLAFAVAVAVEPDLLIIDEALSVGDILFQQKCNAKLRQLKAKGIALLVVTHDTSFVVNMCERALWLNKGKPAFLGQASECVQRYLTAMAAEAGNIVVQRDESHADYKINKPAVSAIDITKVTVLGDNEIYISNVWLLNSAKQDSSNFYVGEWCSLYLEVNSLHDLYFVSAGCEIRDRHGQVIFATGLHVINKLIPHIKFNEARVVKINIQLNLAPGQYTLDVGCGAGKGGDNKGSRIMAASIISIIARPNDEVVHGIVRLPSEIEV